MIKWLLALSFILSSADKLLVQVDDSELSKLVLIQAAVVIAQFKGGEAMLVGTLAHSSCGGWGVYMRACL